MGTSLALGIAAERAGAQAFNAMPNTTFGSVTYDRATPGIETVQVESNTAVIDWRPPALPPGDTTFLFLPDGNTATFQNGPNNFEFVVLNRIVTALPSRFDGTVLGRIRDVSDNVAPGGTILFSSPGGIIAGATSIFDVGNLVLTTLNVVVDGAGDFITPGGGFAFEIDPVAPMPNAAVVTEAGAQILASQPGSYVAFVAPRIVHGGAVQTNGSTALVAAEEVEFTVNNGLFDIVIATGSDNANPIVHTGSTGGPASTGGTDNHVVYMVALPKNQAITALLSGQVGYEPATDATIENGVVVLSSGYNRVNGTEADTLSPSALDASFLVTGGTATSDLFGYAATDMFASGAAASLTFEQDVSLFGRERARLFAANGETVAVGGDAVVSAARNTSDDPISFDVTGGEALVSAESDGSITIAGNLRVDASGTGEGGTVLGDGTGGTAQVVADDGSVQVGDGLLVLAQGTGIGAGFGTALASDGFGGAAGISASGQGSVIVTGDLAVRADGTGGDTGNFLDPGVGTGGNATVEALGDAGIGVSGNATVTAIGTGGGQDLEIIPFDPIAGASGSGGSVLVATAGTGEIAVAGTLSLDAGGVGTSGILGGSGGDGIGGTATASIQAGNAEAASLQLAASGLAGSGSEAIEDGAGNARAGGAGGQGAGGQAIVEVGPGGVLTVDLAALDGEGQGGAGGGGSSGAGTGGQGGAGGDGAGGIAQIRTTGGTFAATTSAGIDLTSSGVGGDGGDGGDATGTPSSGGDGGAAGEGSAGTAAIDVAGGSATATVTDLVSGGFGGSGGVGGSNPDAPGSAGADGSGTGGIARITVADGADTSGGAALGTATLTADAQGGGGATGPGDTAGRIIVTDLGTVAGGLTFAELNASSTGAPAAGGPAFSFSADEGPVTVDGAVDVAVEGDASFAAAGSGGLEAGGVVTVGVGESILLDHDAPAAGAATLSGAAVTLTAGADITGTEDSLVAATTLDASLTAPIVDVGRVSAVRDVLADADTLTIAEAVAGRDVLLDAAGDILVGQAEAGDDFRATAGGTFAAAAVVSTGLGPDSDGTGAPGSDSPAGSNIFVDAGGDLRLDSGAAAAAMRLTSTSGAIASDGLLEAGTNLDAAAPLDIDINDAAAGGTIDLAAGGDLDAADLTAGGSITVAAGGAATIAGADGSTISVDAGGDLRLDDGEASGLLQLTSSGGSVLSDGLLVAGADLTVSAAGDILLGDAEAGNDLLLDSIDGAIGLDRGTAGRDMILYAVVSIDADRLASGRFMDIQTFVGNGDPSIARSITLGRATAGAILTLGAYGPLVADDLVVTGPGLLYAGSTDSTRIGSMSSGGDVELFMSATSPLGLSTNDGRGGIEVGTIEAVGSIRALNETSGVSFGDAEAGGSINVRTTDPDPALAGFTSGAMTAGGSILLAIGGAADLGSLAAGESIDAEASRITLAEGTAGSDLSLDSDSDIIVGSAEAGDDFRAVAAGSFAADSVAATGAGPDSEAGSGALAGAGNIQVQSETDLRLDSATAAGAIDLAATDGSISSATGLSADGALAATAGGGGTFAAISAADVDIDVQATAQFDGLVDAPTIAVSSRDIAISATGALGTGQTGLVLLTALGGGQPTMVGGTADGPGYTLNDAEAGRVTAAILRILAPQAGADPDRDPDLFIGDLSLSGARIGLLDVQTPGIAEINGAVLLTEVRPDGGISLAAGERIQIVTPTGSLRVREASGLPGGTMTLASRDIWSASRTIIDQLRADPAFAGRNEALLLNDGPVEPRGYIEAGDVNLRAGETLLVQNSGDFAVYAGITVVEDTLTVTPTGSAPLDAFAFGRRINPDGSFVTNDRFFAEVVFEGRGGPIGFTDESEFNRCIINTGICPAAIVQVGMPEGSDIIEEPLVTMSTSLLSSNGGDDLVDTSFSADPLIEEPVTSGGDSILWDCDMDGDGDCDEDD